CRLGKSDRAPTVLPRLPQIEYARMAYLIAQDRVAEERAQQSDLWQRFRDTVQLAIVIMTAAGGAVGTAPLTNPWGIIGILLALGGVSALWMAGWPLYRVFRGTEFSYLSPNDV